MYCSVVRHSAAERAITVQWLTGPGPLTVHPNPPYFKGHFCIRAMDLHNKETSVLSGPKRSEVLLYVSIGFSMAVQNSQGLTFGLYRSASE